MVFHFNLNQQVQMIMTSLTYLMLPSCAIFFVYIYNFYSWKLDMECSSYFILSAIIVIHEFLSCAGHKL